MCPRGHAPKFHSAARRLRAGPGLRILAGVSGELHPYDDVERRFCDGDEHPSRRARGRELVARLLGVAEVSAAGLRYDLSFYSGGIGVIDRLHVALPCGAVEVDAIVARGGFVTSEVAVASAPDDFEWLDPEGGEPRTTRELIVGLVDDERADFQPRLDGRGRAWFAPESNVNTWTLLYEQDGRLCLIGRDQG